MANKEIPLLEADDIEVRVQSVVSGNKGVGAVLLLYKNARVDMRILDEVFGPTNWQRTHELINGTLFCSIDIWDDEKGQWVRKQDVGTENNTEKAKSQASDSFKRAGTNVGIGRELYTAPFIYIQLHEREYYQGNIQNGKPVYRCSSWLHFKVAHIEYGNKRRIQALTIVDQDGNVRYQMEETQPQQRQQPQQQPQQGRQYQQAQRAPQQPAGQPMGRDDINLGPRTETAPSAQMLGDNGKLLYCEQCGAVLKPTKGKRGRLWTPQDIADLSIGEFGVTLCPACQKVNRDMYHHAK